ncbi:hypothetical protein FRB99_008602, partial [Tulasnella sp. 403]
VAKSIGSQTSRSAPSSQKSHKSTPSKFLTPSRSHQPSHRSPPVHLTSDPADPSHPLPPSIPALCQIMDDASLRKFGLLINQAYHLIICTFCRLALSSFDNHQCPERVKNVICPVVSSILKSNYSHLVRDRTSGFPPLSEQYAPEMPRHAGDPPVFYLEIQGIKVVNGIVCSSCSKGFTANASFASHICTDRSARSAITFPIQKVYPGQGQSWYPVRRIADNHTLTDVELFFITQPNTDPDFKHQSLADQIHNSPYMQFSGFATWAGDHQFHHEDLQRIHHYADPPEKDGPWALLAPYVDLYVESVTSRFSESNRYLRQIICTGSTTQTSYKCLDTFARDKTAVRYGLVLTRLLAHSFRVLDCDDLVKFQDAQSRHVQALLSLFSPHPPPDPSLLSSKDVAQWRLDPDTAPDEHAQALEVLGAIHSAACSVLQHKFDVLNEMDSELQVFVISLALNDSGAWAHHLGTVEYLSALSWLSRLVVFENVMVKAQGVADDAMAAVQDEIFWVDNTKPTAFMWFKQLSSCIATLQYASEARPVFDFDDGHYVFKGHKFTFAQLYKFIHETRNELSRNLRLVFSLCGSSFDIDTPLTGVVDNLSDNTYGYSFLSATPDLWDQRHSLFNSLLTTSTAHTRIADNLIFDPAFVSNILSVCETVTLLFQAVLETTSGGTFRASEGESYSFLNLSRPRTTVWHKDRVVFISSYHKGQTQTQSDKFVARALDLDVSHWFAYWAAFVRPLERTLHMQVNNMSVEQANLYMKEVFWSNGSLGAHHLTNTLHHLCGKYFPFNFGTRDWRHINIFLSHHVLQDRADMAIVKTIIDLQSGHSEHIADHVYGLDMARLNNINRVKVNSYVAATCLWQKLFGLPVGHIPSLIPSHGPGPQTETVASHTASEVMVAMDRASSTVEVYTSTMLNVASGVRDQLDDIHARLIRMSDPDPSRPVNAPVPTCHLLDSDLLSVLKSTTGFTRFKSAQQSTLVKHALTASNLLGISATGSGKTLAYILPAHPALRRPSQDGLTIVGVPYLSLLRDVIRRCENLVGMTVVEYEDEMTVVSNADVIVVTFDKLLRPEFAQYLRRYGRRGEKPACVVIDEAQLLLLESSFRSQLHAAPNLALWDCPKSVITATATPAIVDKLIATLGFQEYSLSRSPSHHANIEFSIQEANVVNFCYSPPVIADIQQLVAPSVQALAPEERIIIYTCSIPLCEALATKMGASYYHAQMGINQRARAAATWRDGRTKVMVCTIAFGSGNDTPNVRSVFLASIPTDLIEWTQLSGQAGRDGKPSKSVVLIPKSATRAESSTPHHGNLGCREEMLDAFFDKKACLRLVQDSILDDEPLTCLMRGDGCIPCQRCQAHSPYTPPTPPNTPTSTAVSTPASTSPVSTPPQPVYSNCTFVIPGGDPSQFPMVSSLPSLSSLAPVSPSPARPAPAAIVSRKRQAEPQAPQRPAKRVADDAVFMGNIDARIATRAARSVNDRVANLARVTIANRKYCVFCWWTTNHQTSDHNLQRCAEAAKDSDNWEAAKCPREYFKPTTEHPFPEFYTCFICDLPYSVHRGTRCDRQTYVDFVLPLVAVVWAYEHDAITTEFLEVASMDTADFFLWARFKTVNPYSWINLHEVFEFLILLHEKRFPSN